MIRVKFFGLLRMRLGVQETAVDPEHATVGEALRAAEKKIGSPFLHLLTDTRGEPGGGVIILVNGLNVVLDQKMATPVIDGDEIDLFPPVGGG